MRRKSFMKKSMKWLTSGVLLVSLLVWGMPAAAAPVTIEVHNPTGSVQVTELFAPRLADLNGKTVCEFANGSWEDYRTFPLIRKALQERFPAIKIIEYAKMPRFNKKNLAEQFSERTLPEELAKMAKAAKAAGCQAAIVGNAG